MHKNDHHYYKYYLSSYYEYDYNYDGYHHYENYHHFCSDLSYCRYHN